MLKIIDTGFPPARDSGGRLPYPDKSGFAMTYGRGREGEKQMIRGLEVLKNSENDLYIFGYPAN